MVRGIHTYSVCTKAEKPRIYLENMALWDANFTPGTPIEIEYGHEIVLRRTTEENAEFHIIHRKRNGRIIPVIDFTRGVGELFEYKEKIRVEVRDGEIRISKHQSFTVIEAGHPVDVSESDVFSVLELPSGAGLAGFAFEQTGLYKVVGAGDMDERALEAVRFNHPDTTLFHSNLYDLHQDDIPAADVFVFTPDCTAYSRLGKRNYVSSASAPMIHHGIRIISAKRFPVVLVENVVEFGRSIWYSHYKRLMNIMGYTITDGVLNAWDYGTIASRPRFISIATRHPYQFEFPQPHLNPGQRDRVRKHVHELESRNWLSISTNKTLSYYFGEHREVHTTKGNGFSISERALVSMNDTKIPAFIAGYFPSLKAQGPYLKHPTDPDKLSLFTPSEILSIQGFEQYELPSWHSLSTQYKLIGQAVCGRMFRALATAVATVLMEMRLTGGLQPRKRSGRTKRDGTQLCLGI